MAAIRPGCCFLSISLESSTSSPTTQLTNSSGISFEAQVLRRHYAKQPIFAYCQLEISNTILLPRHRNAEHRNHLGRSIEGQHETDLESVGANAVENENLIIRYKDGISIRTAPHVAGSLVAKLTRA